MSVTVESTILLLESSISGQLCSQRTFIVQASLMMIVIYDCHIFQFRPLDLHCLLYRHGKIQDFFYLLLLYPRNQGKYNACQGTVVVTAVFAMTDCECERTLTAQNCLKTLKISFTTVVARNVQNIGDAKNIWKAEKFLPL